MASSPAGSPVPSSLGLCVLLHHALLAEFLRGVLQADAQLSAPARVELFYCAREVPCSPRRVELPRRVSLFRADCLLRADSWLS
jgi:hypothetical protein|uniref:Secreted protein n=1 Tax=Zea mays TaxID=4577 RepID=B6SRS9_MAIZE|nr:hypothetical protein [Zea mays]